MDKLNRIVVSHIEERLLDPERIEDVLASLLARRQESIERRQHIAELNQRATEADNRLKRLYDAIEAGFGIRPRRVDRGPYRVTGSGAGRRGKDRGHAEKLGPSGPHRGGRAGTDERRGRGRRDLHQRQQKHPVGDADSH
ncbi:hypothetical protein [uncultured Pleomorphomonas sp.]|nr:hypothetical protein [uncultured Pleomorphomonas sp.]